MTRRGRGRLRLVLAAVSASMVLIGCEAQATPSAVALHAYGDPLDPGQKPAADPCRLRLGSEEVAAARIRVDVHIDGISSEPAAIKAAAADPTADLATLAIPLTAAEKQALTRSGFAIEAFTPMSYLVSVGAPERYGGIWVDSGRTIVAVVNGDPDALALARCVEAPGAKYVWATISMADGEAISSRIGADIVAWRARGVPVNSVYYDVTTGVIVVGVTQFDDRLVADFQARYGPLIRLKVEGPAVRM